MNDPGGREQLTALGLKSVPVVVRGTEYVFGQSIEAVARFVGVEGYREVKLAPAQLMEKWRAVIAAGQRLIVQFPADRLGERVHPGRDQSIRNMGYHVFRIGHAFIQTVEHGLVEWVPVSMEAPPPACASGADVAAYGSRVRGELDHWWSAQTESTLGRVVKTYSGDMIVRDLLERQTWHSAQHVRQLAWALEQLGIRPDGPLTRNDLAGLPIPEAIWE